ncbi:MAG: hypothetical protein P4M08_02745 [Oligoflexia bacterium]|nr:hypothetical protein [Oligoflexia bacterium]
MKPTTLVLMIFSTAIALVPSLARAEADATEHEMKMDQATSSADCSDMETWDVSMGMCMPLSMAGMPMKMLMLHGNAFATGITESGPRGRTDFAAPNMFMADLGTSIGDSHYLNLDYMGTFERWTIPYQGYPELLQIGETNSQGAPFMDAQHPHSSPVMGLTLSDTISFGVEKNSLKLFFAPRGEATDGPIAFMHRVTGMVNPDAPLGHHIGQDVGHISSTVIGASLRLGNTRIEASTYHGAEPEPDNVDLPIGTPDSVSLRLIEEFSPTFMGMVSVARVNAPEPDQPDVAFENRYSASVYWQKPLSSEWTFYDTLIYGLVTQYDHADYLSSFSEEFLFKGDHPRIWGRIEVLQRTPSELEIVGPSNPNSGEWVTALTVGYTHKVASWGGVELGVGGSVTKDILPSDFIGAYGGNPWTGKVFLQLSGMGMWAL